MSDSKKVLTKAIVSSTNLSIYGAKTFDELCILFGGWVINER
jgi:hypothetical protein